MTSKRLTGANKALRRLRALNSRSAEKRVGAALYVAGDMMRVEAALSISAGAVSGKNHVPSNPGEPPNFDTGVLAAGLETREVGDFEVNVVSTAPYSAALEFGTSKMAERPFMAPAARKVERKAHQLVRAAMRNEIRRK